MRNIVLIGMPGSGKSTLGVLLAKTMGLDFVDTDLLIQRRCGDRLQALLDAKGVDAFLKLEEETICRLNAKASVIATGGSAVYGQAAMRHLRQNGIVVYLKLSYEEIERRIKNLPSRGVALREHQTLHDLYIERVPLYESACDLCFEPRMRRMEEEAEALSQAVRAFEAK